jgi:hypothetical protein
MIDPTLTLKFEYLGTYDISIIRNSLDSTTKFELDSQPVEKLGLKNFDLMVYNPLQRPRFIGGLFKPIKNLMT